MGDSWWGPGQLLDLGHEIVQGNICVKELVSMAKPQAPQHRFLYSESSPGV